MPFFPLGSAFRGGPAHLARHAAIVLVADKHGATPAQIALAWLLARYERMLLIPGTSSIVHLDENMAAIGLALDDADLAVPRSSPVTKAPASPAVSRALRSMTCASTVSRSFPLPVRRCLHPQPRRRVARPRRSGDAGAADRGRQADLIRSGRLVVGGVSQKQVRRRTVSGQCPLTYRVCGPACPRVMVTSEGGLRADERDGLRRCRVSPPAALVGLVALVRCGSGSRERMRTRGLIGPSIQGARRLLRRQRRSSAVERVRRSRR